MFCPLFIVSDFVFSLKNSRETKKKLKCQESLISTLSLLCALSRSVSPSSLLSLHATKLLLL